MADPRVVGRFLERIVDGDNRDLLRVVPRRGTTSRGERQCIAADHLTVDEDHLDLSVLAEAGQRIDGGDIDQHITGRLLGQDDPVLVLQQSVRRSRIIRRNAIGDRSALGHDGLVLIWERRGIVVDRRDKDRCRIIIDDFGDDAQNRQPVVGTAILRTAALLDAMLDIDGTRSLSQVVILRCDRDCLRNEPVGPSKYECGADLAAIQCDALAAGGLLALAQWHGGGRDQHVLFRRTAQDNLIDIDDKACMSRGVFEDPDRTVLQKHDDAGLVVVGHVGGNIPDEDVLVIRIVAAHRLDDQTAVALQVVTDDGDFLAVAAADVEGVTANSADDLQGHAFAGALDEEPVVTFQRIDDDPLKTRVGNEQAGAVDALVVDDEVVAELGADHRQCVKAVAALDPDRSVDRERDEVCALATVDVGVRRLGIVRIDLDEGAYGEGVVVLVTEQEQLGLVAVDGEVVVADTAEQGRALADAVAEEAARDLSGLEVVFLGETVIRVPAIPPRLENLTDLEGIVACVAEDDRRRQVVVQDEGVVAVAPVDFDRTADVAVVVDPLNDAARDWLAVLVDFDGRNHTLPDVLVGPQQEEVYFVGPEDPETVDAGVAPGLIEDVDPRGDAAGQADLVLVAALLSVQRQFAVDAAPEGLLAVPVVVDPDDVVTVSEINGGGSGNAINIDDVVCAVDHGRFVSGVDEGHAGVCRLHVETIVVVAQPGLQDLEVLIGDAEGHAHTDELGCGQLAVFLLRIAGIVNLQGVAAVLAEDREPGLDVVDGAGEGIQDAVHLTHMASRAADPDAVAAATRHDVGLAGDRLDIDDVRAIAAGERGHRPAAVGALDRKDVTTESSAEVDIQFLEGAIGDAARRTH